MYAAFKTLLDSVKARHERRIAIRELSAMNDHQLADLGIERGWVIDAVDGSLPAGKVWAGR